MNIRNHNQETNKAISTKKHKKEGDNNKHQKPRPWNQQGNTNHKE
jgi:hypothetical protein